MGVENYDLKTVAKQVTTAPTSLGLGAVPSGMKRWVTFIGVENAYGGVQTVYFASTATDLSASTATAASAGAKLRVRLGVNETRYLPVDKPDPDNPLFSIAGGSYMEVWPNRGSALVFIQYYDHP